MKTVAKSFGLLIPPSIDIGVPYSGKFKRRNQDDDDNKKKFKKKKIFTQPKNPAKFMR